YHESLCVELGIRGIQFRSKAEIDVFYKGHIIKGLEVDILVEEAVIVEIKSLVRLPDVALAQTLSYLKATGMKRGLLINFGQTRLIDGVKRVSL
ncbi:MAG TPA: GxxExxY protein, partial [Candidatus Saccharimonadales bacterium]|nr:GxxExxY protein [Candidatus Saccharimonadales bacterium]